MGAPKKYTPEQLEKAVNKYFAGITRKKTVTEPVPTGERDDHGHMIYEEKPVLNGKGKEVVIEEFIVPPSIGDLCVNHLKIHRSTWDNYSNDPEYFDTTTRARGRIYAYLERESLTRSDKGLKGVIWNMEQNYDCKKQQLEISAGEGLEEYLQKMAEQGGGQEF